MQWRYFLAAVIIILGALVMLTPYYIFPVCEVGIPTAGGKVVPMKCFWTARAVLGGGGAIFFGGVLLAFVKSGEARRGIFLMLFVIGVLVALFPNGLIGVCDSENMRCRMGTLPAVTLLGGLTAAISLVAAIWGGKTPHTRSGSD